MSKIEIANVLFEYDEIGEGECFVIFPGTLGDFETFEYLATALSSRFRVCVINTINAPSFHDIIPAMHELFEQKKITNPIILGSSLGGWLAQFYASTYSTQIKATILGNTFCKNTLLRKKNRILFPLTKFLPLSFIRNVMLKQMKQLKEEYERGEALLENLKRNLFSFDKKLLRKRLSWSLSNVEPEIGKITAPVLVIGTEDDFLEPELFDQLRKCYSNSEIVKLENGAHFPYYLTSENYIKVVNDFIDKLANS